MPHIAKASTSTTGSDVLTADTTGPSSIDNGRKVPKSLVLPSHHSSRPSSQAPMSPAISGFHFGDPSEPASPRSSGPNIPLSPGGSVQHPDWETSQSGKSVKSSKSMKEMRKKSVVQAPPLAQQQDPGRRKTLYFDDQFSYKDGWDHHTTDQARHESPVIAELRTNVIIKDEYSLVTDLSSHIALRYQRPEASVMITITHSACLMYGGTFEPAYFLNMSAVEAHCQAATNKRNSALTQAFLSEVLGVTPDRGVVKFSPIREDCLATNGRTVSGEIDKLEDQNSGGLRKAISNAKRKSVSARKSTIEANGDTMSSPPEKEKRKMSIFGSRKSSTTTGAEEQKPKQRRVSLHPPKNMMEDVDERSTHSSTPEIPSPKYLSKGQPYKEQRVRNAPPSLYPSTKLNDSTVFICTSTHIEPAKPSTIPKTKGWIYQPLAPFVEQEYG
ncbi:hypothetical protein BT63DRAFT_150642 [Microthyrium microscopicum]|uniref:L-dopachrome isomerase n=1 Tax=Microthyrium microscopicum TaxID=703497 RepID=A0A6A6UP63_9PEZI|nr:hypothetical protein BT63DRAFT_150642 [Microthyrium microscopicum]